MLEDIFNNKTNLLLTILMLLLMVFNIMLFNNKILTPTMHNNEIKKQYEENMVQIDKEKTESNVEEKVLTEEEMQAEYLTDLKSMDEVNRMYSYFHKYIEMVEQEQYEEAFSLLNEDFIAQYFGNIDNYTKYVKERYPTFIATEYNGIERQGEYYILTVNIKNAVDYGMDESLMQKFVIHEKGIDNFELSFQVI